MKVTFSVPKAASIVIALAGVAHGQGLSTFELSNAPWSQAVAPIFDAEGQPLGPEFSVELWGAATPDALVPAYDFLTGARLIIPFFDTPLLGYFNDSAQMVVSAAPFDGGHSHNRAGRFGQPGPAHQSLHRHCLRTELSIFRGCGSRLARTVPTYTRWVQVEQRTFLVESCEYLALKPLLAPLPAFGAAGQGQERLQRLAQANRSPERRIPLGGPPPTEPPAWQVADLRGASSRPDIHRGLVWDYSLLLTTTNLVLAGDRTWLVMGTVNLSGTDNVLEGGAVLKFTNSTSAKINVLGSLKCRTDNYLPAVLTSYSDDTIGEIIAGSTGSPGLHGSGLVFNNSPVSLGNVRFAHAESGVSGQLNLTNVQFVKCKYPINSTTYDQNSIWADNALFFDSVNAVKGGRDLLVRGSHWTVNQCDKLGSFTSGETELYLTNSILVRLTNGLGNFSSITTNNTAKLDSDSGVFQEVGGGSHYLASTGVGATLRNAGTTSINPEALAQIRQRTVDPPLVLSNRIERDMILTPWFRPDINTPDLGYHYELLHWSASGTVVTNATLLLTNGVVVATHGSSSSRTASPIISRTGAGRARPTRPGRPPGSTRTRTRMA